MLHTSSIRWSENLHSSSSSAISVLVCKFLKIHACLHDLPGLWIMISRNADKLVSLGLRMTCSWSTSWKDQVFQKCHKTNGMHFQQNINDVHVWFSWTLLQAHATCGGFPNELSKGCLALFRVPSPPDSNLGLEAVNAGVLQHMY